MKYLLIIILNLFFTCSLFAQTKIEKGNITVPINLKQSFAILDSLLSSEDVSLLKNEAEENISKYHMTLGLWIRNNWGLWNQDTPISKYFNDLGIYHPDDMSGIIIASYWRYLNGHPIDLDSQIQHYKNYWDAQPDSTISNLPELPDPNPRVEQNNSQNVDFVQIKTTNNYDFYLNKSREDFYNLLISNNIDTNTVWFYYYESKRDTNEYPASSPQSFVKFLVGETVYLETGRLWVFDAKKDKNAILEYCEKVDFSKPIEKLLSDKVKLEYFVRPSTGEAYLYRTNIE